MHLVEAARTRMKCIPVVHESAAVIGAEYFNQIAEQGRAYALVTSGPGVTNALTGMAGAYLESRDVLVVAGQVKSTDLARGELRQRGIQELDGLSMAIPVSVAAMRVEAPISDDEIGEVIQKGLTGRKGPVYLEICLDAQGAPLEPNTSEHSLRKAANSSPPANDASADVTIWNALSNANRPVILIGGGVSFQTSVECRSGLERLGVPLMTTWNGFDRVSDAHPCFAGRPNTWGQRAANIILSQADCVIALGTRLGIQQTGFNWKLWGPPEGDGTVIQVDIDEKELRKGHPRVDIALQSDANEALRVLSTESSLRSEDWWAYIGMVRTLVPVIDPSNTNNSQFLSPYNLVDQLSDFLDEGDVLVPASSGSGQFVPMETFRLKPGQRVITNKGLASMGYGLAGAIGAAFAANGRTVLIEGDGSFSQSIQELGTLAVNRLPVKIFLLDNDGYASIRTTQKTYFGGAYLGCDTSTGLGFPDWRMLAKSFGIPSVDVGADGLENKDVLQLLNSEGPGMFVVAVDPNQTYFPKVSSRIVGGGKMESNPVHLMSPPLPDEIAEQVFRFRRITL